MASSMSTEHVSVERWFVKIEPQEGEPFDVACDECSCGEVVVGGDFPFRRHQFSTIDPLLVREGIMQTGLYLARKMDNHHGIVKHWRDRRKEWRRKVYATG